MLGFGFQNQFRLFHAAIMPQTRLDIKSLAAGRVNKSILER
jgi:hypothetical protein